MYNPIMEAMRKIQEMAIEQEKVMSDVRSKVNELTLHLIKCFVYKDITGNLKHWEREIYGFLPHVPKVKNTKKFPSYKKLKENTIDMIEDVLLNRIKNNIDYLEDLGYPKDIKYDKNKVYNCIIEYYDWLIKELSTKGEININETYNKINELMKKLN